VISNTEKAALLRRAAEQIEKDQFIEENLGHIYNTTYKAWLRVAVFLKAAALNLEVNPAAVKTHAFRIAQAYLGEEEPDDD
jgi:hypothetical protein